jgi:hypothetical protein
LPKVFRAFRFDPPTIYELQRFSAQERLTATGALERFMADAVDFGLVFPSAKNAAAKAEARVMLAWLKEGKYWVNLGGKEETSMRGRLECLVCLFKCGLPSILLKMILCSMKK